MTTFSSRKTYTEGENIAPGQTGRTDIGYENLQVKMLYWPDKLDFYRLMSKSSVAVKGNIIEDDGVDEIMVEDMFRGGLNQSLEWLPVIFEVAGVSRGVTHQLVRTRKASFAQQSLRYADVGNFNVRMPVEIANREDRHPINYLYPSLQKITGQYATPAEVWRAAVDVAREAYAWLADQEIPMQDARTILPIGTETYIICQYPLSEFLALYSYRACQMFYPEMVALMAKMKEKLLEKCEWLEPHIKISCEKTSPGKHGLPHQCTYQGFERVEGQCSLSWAVEDNRIYKSRKEDR
jgi:flavin-dependent thymidylate synthase